jgi:hypothetical protein
LESDHKEARELARLQETMTTARELLHEGTTHLGIILGYSELLGKHGTEQQVGAAREIATAAQELGDLFGRLLRLLHAEAEA